MLDNCSSAPNEHGWMVKISLIFTLHKLSEKVFGFSSSNITQTISQFPNPSEDALNTISGLETKILSLLERRQELYAKEFKIWINVRSKKQLNSNFDEKVDRCVSLSLSAFQKYREVGCIEEAGMEAQHFYNSRLIPNELHLSLKEAIRQDKRVPAGKMATSLWLAV